MKKLLISLFLVLTCFSLVGCGDKENTGKKSGGSKKENANWMEVFGMSNLKVPEGATVEKGPSYSDTDKQIKRDTEFTDAEIDAFAQSVLENCDGAYKSKYNSATDEYEKVALKDASEAKGDDEYGWQYDIDGKTYSIRIYFGTRKSMRFERY